MRERMVGAFMAKVGHDILADRAFEHVIPEEAEPDIREKYWLLTFLKETRRMTTWTTKVTEKGKVKCVLELVGGILRVCVCAHPLFGREYLSDPLCEDKYNAKFAKEPNF
jgi:hypothetical protein